MTIRLNPDLRIQERRIGDDARCVVVDDLLAEPDSLIELAVQRAGRFRTHSIGYPGLTLDLEPELLKDFHRFILRRMGGIFGFLRGGATLATGLTMTTRKPEDLTTFQRLCHTDPRDLRGRRKFAALVYLFTDESLGGTAFYRWRKPEIVYRALELEQADPRAALELLAEHSSVFREAPRYSTASNDLAELVEVIPARFNRFVFYSGEMPHSGHITAPERLTTDFRRGRLTLNCFASVVPGVADHRC